MKNVAGLWVLLLTPMYRGTYDAESMSRLLKLIEPHVTGYVPCLSTGEGDVLSNKLWGEVIKDLRAKTEKPILAGIKRGEMKDILNLARMARKAGCEAIVVPVPSNSEAKSLNFFSKLTKASPLPIVAYNTESTAFSTVEGIKKLDKIDKIIALKDSSMNIVLFQILVKLRSKNKLRICLLQGMEHQLFASKGCDGFLTSLLNNEPVLCKKLFETFSEVFHRQIMEKLWWQHNLGGEWYVTLKALLYGQGVLRSAEQVKQMVKL